MTRKRLKRLSPTEETGDKEEKGKEAEAAGENAENGAQIETARNEESKEAADTAVDDRGVEEHEEYNQSQADHEEYANTVYDPSEVSVLEINSRSKASCLKKVLLERKNMKKANIMLFRQTMVKNPNAPAPTQPTPQQM